MVEPFLAHLGFSLPSVETHYDYSAMPNDWSQKNDTRDFSRKRGEERIHLPPTLWTESQEKIKKSLLWSNFLKLSCLSCSVKRGISSKSSFTFAGKGLLQTKQFLIPIFSKAGLEKIQPQARTQTKRIPPVASSPEEGQTKEPLSPFLNSILQLIKSLSLWMWWNPGGNSKKKNAICKVNYSKDWIFFPGSIFEMITHSLC